MELKPINLLFIVVGAALTTVGQVYFPQVTLLSMLGSLLVGVGINPKQRPVEPLPPPGGDAR